VKREHLMCDVETLSTSPNAAVISIAAVVFSPFENNEKNGYDIPYSDVSKLPHYHSNITFQSALTCGLSVDGDTIAFWLKQTKEIQDGLFSPPQISLKEAIRWFLGWFQEQENLVRDYSGDQEKMKVWGHGATFDPVILGNVIRKCGYEVPWKYYNVRDTRTLFDLAQVDCRKELGIPNLDYFGNKHNPLVDCQRQVLLVQEAYRKLGVKEPCLQQS
jgi:exodeoxyribonuclease VIII